MASPAWAVPNLTGFSDPGGNACELRARLGAKVLFNIVAGGSFKGDAAELVCLGGALAEIGDAAAGSAGPARAPHAGGGSAGL